MPPASRITIRGKGDSASIHRQGVRRPRQLWSLIAWIGLFSLAGSDRAPAFCYLTSPPTVWPAGNVSIVLKLGSAGRTLIDGNMSWDTVAQQALASWNSSLGTIRFVPTTQSPGVGSAGDHVNQVFFASTIYGQSFGMALSITKGWYRGTNLTETDVIFNTAYSWDSYRGQWRPPDAPYLLDLRRVALHEFGHIVGLDHPDQAGQTVSAIMNSSVSDLDSLTADDMAGAATLYRGKMPGAQGKGSTYNGLFYEDDGIRLTSAGSFTLALTASRKYSGRLRLGAKRYSFSGLLDPQQNGGPNVISRRDGPALTLSFHLSDGDPADQIAGHLTDGTWTSTLSGDRAVFGKTSPAPYAGSYTLVIPGSDGSSSLPAGNGFGTVKVDASGKVKFTGTLADGTKVSQSASLSRDGEWPLHVPLYSGNGCLMSWLAFAGQPNSDLSGRLTWIKEAGSKSKYYLGGFTCVGDILGSTYLRTDPVLSLPTASLTFHGGSLVSDITNSITIGPRNKVVTPGKALKLRFSASSGTFKGTFIDPVADKPLSFSGAVFQKLNTGYGVLFGTGDQPSAVGLAAP